MTFEFEQINLLNTLLYGVLLSQAAILGAFGVVHLRQAKAALPLIGLAAAFLAFASTPFASHSGWIFGLQLSMFVESLLPVMFWYVASSLFDDEFAWNRWHVIGLMAAIVSLANVWTLSWQGGDAKVWSHIFVTILKYIHMVCIVAGLSAAARDWRVDLVAARLKIRVFVVIVSGMALMAMIFAGYYAVEARALDSSLSLFVSPLVIATLFGANVFLIRHADLLEPAVQSLATFTPTEPQKTPEVDPLPQSIEVSDPSDDQAPVAFSKRLAEFMESEHGYRDENLTIGLLASRLKVPEYRLRAHINSTQGFRNFNQFLAHYRIGLACRLLVDPNRSQDKVISIALEVGYASLAPFNKAFKDKTGLTPTDYRRQGGDGASSIS
jgi:AraC-like DNA-binding protein